MDCIEEIGRKAWDESKHNIQQAMLSPCGSCAKSSKWHGPITGIESVLEQERLKKECQGNCEEFTYYAKYRLNPEVEPYIEEITYLYYLTRFLIEERWGNFSEDDIDRLKLWSERLYIVTNWLEMRVAAAKLAMEYAGKAISGKDKD